MAKLATPPASSPDALTRMKRQRRRDTAPEIALRRELHRLGLRYRVHRPPLPALRREADVIFPRARVAVFVDSCFWHGCPEHYTAPKANAAFWRAKIARNLARDRAADEGLARLGWIPIRIWEHDVTRCLPGVVARILEAIRRA